MKAKIFVAVTTALLFNVIIGGAIAFASGLSPTALILGGLTLSSVMPKMGGVTNMAIQKEIWITSIVEGLFADNSFLSKAFDADEFVEAGKVVNIPNAGLPSGVVKNRTSFPATVHTRTDINLTFNLDEFSTNPIRIPYADTIELSYNKRESVIKQDKANLLEEISNAIIKEWSPGSTRVVRTSGSANQAYVPSATGYRKMLTKEDIGLVMTQFNKEDIPSEGRYLLLDAMMHSELLKSLTEKEALAFHSAADVEKGVVGKLMGFNVMMRSKVGRYTAALAPKDWEATGAATDHGAALAWHVNSVCRALGEVEMFDNVSDPTYYGDIYSFLVRAGGRPMRDDLKGLMAIVQDTATEPTL